MEREMVINVIGHVHINDGAFNIQLKEEYRAGLININGFSHLQMIWWANKCDTPNDRNRLINQRPYTTGPEKIGVFATRSQFRPNPILLTVINVTEIDFEKGIIYTPYLDAENKTPVLDIKPYHRNERVEECDTPQWCKHWPSSYEESSRFNWSEEFNF